MDGKVDRYPNRPRREDLMTSPTHKRTRSNLRAALTVPLGDVTIGSLCPPIIHAIRTLDLLVRDRGEGHPPLDEAERAVTRSFSYLREIGLQHPEASELAFRAAEEMMLAWALTASRMSAEQVMRELATMRPLTEANSAKAAAVDRAQAIAAELWRADTAQEIRLGDMADRVYRALAAEGFTASLPGTAERIKEWIKSAAPDYASKGGRRRKTP